MTEACMQHGFKFWLKSSELFCSFYNLEIGVAVFQISGCIFVSNLTRRRLNLRIMDVSKLVLSCSVLEPKIRFRKRARARSKNESE